MSINLTITETLYDGSPAKAESDLFSWFWGQDGYLQERATGRCIYQCAYMREHEFGSDPVSQETKAAVIGFWAALRAEQERARKAYEAQIEAEMAKEDAERSKVADKDKAIAYDNLQNEGYSDGYNPYR